MHSNTATILLSLGLYSIGVISCTFDFRDTIYFRNFCIQNDIVIKHVKKQINYAIE